MNEATRTTLVKAADALCEYLMDDAHQAAYDVARTIVWLLDCTPADRAKPGANDMTEEWRKMLAKKVTILRTRPPTS